MNVIIVSVFPFPDDLGQNAVGPELPQLGSTGVTQWSITVKTRSFTFLDLLLCPEQFCTAASRCNPTVF